MGREAHGRPALTRSDGGQGRTAHRRRHRPSPTLVAAVVLFLGLVTRLVAVEPFSVPTDSMAPTILAGDHVLANKLAYRVGDPRPDDLVVFHSPADGELLIKRVVALAGDRVAIEDGVLTVNGRARAEPYVDSELVDTAYFGPVRVPQGGVFVLGDRRHDSIDSRNFGPVERADIVGRVRQRLWPPKRIGSV